MQPSVLSGEENSIHVGIQCDGCSQMPIVGARFNCGSCADYDLCRQCSATASILHPRAGHVFRMIPAPAATSVTGEGGASTTGGAASVPAGSAATDPAVAPDAVPHPSATPTSGDTALMAVPVAGAPAPEKPLTGTVGMPVVGALEAPARPTLTRQRSRSLSPVRPGCESDHGIKVQKNKGRCFTCNAKVTLALQQSCKCGYVFCALHKPPEKHRCTFDFKAEARRNLQQLNPVVATPKFERL
jgi:hypothetical protein